MRELVREMFVDEACHSTSRRAQLGACLEPFGAGVQLLGYLVAGSDDRHRLALLALAVLLDLAGVQ